MGRGDRVDVLARGWRGPILAALLALAAALPGALALPTLDRDEARFAEASAQMLESGDFVTIRFQDAPRFKKPVGIYWLQAAAARIFVGADDRRIWAYRLPSLAGAMIAAAACAWGAAAFLGPGLGLAAGAMLGSSFILSTEAMIATTDAGLAGATTTAMAAVARLYLAARGGPPAGGWVRFLFWSALAVSVLIKGPIGPMVVVLALVFLCLWERKADWLRGLGWGWGLIVFFTVVGPWAMAVTVATDGTFWGQAVGGDLAPKLVGGQEGHGAPPGYYLLLAPILVFPATLLLPAGLLAGWRARAEPGVRFALCWLLPAWLVFELVPTKLVHYTLPLYVALAWLMARALGGPIGRGARLTGAALAVLAGAVLAAAGPAALVELHLPAPAPWALAAAILVATAAAAGAGLLVRLRPRVALAVSGLIAVAAHDVLAAGLAPRLSPLWLSDRAARGMSAAGESPREGGAGPVAVAGYEEPSLVFLLGADTELAGPEEAADAIAEGDPAIVEAREDAAFRTALAENEAQARLLGEVVGLDYSNGRHDILRLYAPEQTGGTVSR
ncbi:MAG: ArnT family glycosyltransferase [Caulobacteraceae bacterium]